LATREKVLGRDHPDTAKSLNSLAELYQVQRRYADALPIVQRTIAQNSANKSVAFAIMYHSQSHNLLSPTQAIGASYNVLQRSASSAAGEAVSRLAARFAAGSDELSQLVRKDQDLTTEADRLDKNIIAALSKLPAERNAAVEEQIRNRINEIKSERDKLQDAFNQRFPDYVALSKPQPLAIEQTHALLADDEALVVIDLDKKAMAGLSPKTEQNGKNSRSVRKMCPNWLRLCAPDLIQIRPSRSTAISHISSIASCLNQWKRLSPKRRGCPSSSMGH
jgi:hypothetical protein